MPLLYVEPPLLWVPKLADQVLLHEKTWRRLLEMQETSLLSSVKFQNMGLHKFKGISKDVHVVQVCIANVVRLQTSVRRRPVLF